MQQINEQNLYVLQLLYDRHATVVYSLIIRMVKRETIAEQILCDTFGEMWKQVTQLHLDDAQPESIDDHELCLNSIFTVLCNIARTKCLNHLRHTPSQQLPRLTKYKIFTKKQQHSETDEKLRHQLNIIRDKLTEEQCLYLDMAFFEGYTFCEIAEEMNVARDAVQMHINSALQVMNNYFLQFHSSLSECS